MTVETLGRDDQVSRELFKTPINSRRVVHFKVKLVVNEHAEFNEFCHQMDYTVTHKDILFTEIVEWEWSEETV